MGASRLALGGPSLIKLLATILAPEAAGAITRFPELDTAAAQAVLLGMVPD